MSLPPRAGAFLALVSVVAFLAAVCAPLATYALTLALFGMVHVLVELRYVDERFTGRVPWRLGSVLLGILGAIVAVRLLGLVALLPPGWDARLELLLVALLVAVALPVLRGAGVLRAMLGSALLLLLVGGALYAPLVTLVLFAVAHNLTPLGFLADALAGRQRRIALAWGILLFLAAPLLLATGLPARWLFAVGLDVPVFWGVGAPESNLRAFVPGPWLGHPRAVDLFSAAVYLQCLHYAVVIHVLPRLDPVPGPRRERVPWPARRRFVPLLALVAAVSLAAFSLSFGDARAAYGLFALVHAWIEIPLLLLALALRPPAVLVSATPPAGERGGSGGSSALPTPP